MVLVKKIQLVTRNSRDKIQQVEAFLYQEGTTFEIHRFTGQRGGKQTEQPILTITKGKAKRNSFEQAELEFNSIINKYKDKGYKNLSDLSKETLESIDNSILESLVPTTKEDQQGFKKPMLAKSADAVQTSVLNKKHLCSRKLDGVRAMFQLNTDGELVAVSRGGKIYTEPTNLIKEELEPFFKDNPKIILDGELYIHGHHLQEISGMCRLQKWEDRCSKLEYWIYDIADDTLKFTERLKLLNSFKELFEDYPRIKILEHVETNSYLDMKKLHDLWVSEGFEGLVARKPDKVYGYGKRGSDMLKLKDYQEDEFEIIDYKEGLRDEDFCFICQTKKGKTFAAKPIGDRELKEQYMKDIDNIIGKFGTVKYFNMTKDDIPSQPILKVIRDYE